MPQALPSIAVYRRIAIGLLMTVGVVFLSVLYIALVRAEITIKLRKQPFPLQHTFSVTHDVGRKPASVPSALPGYIEIVERLTTRDVPASASGYQEGKAEGMIRITNRYSRPQPLIATTRLLSKEGILFRTTESTLVPVGGSVDVPVRADAPGPKGDIGPSTFILPGLWPGIQDKITGSSVKPMSGGRRPIVQLAPAQQKELEHSAAEEQRLAVEKAGSSAPRASDQVRIVTVGSVRSTPSVVNDHTIRLSITSVIVVATFNPQPLEVPLKAVVAKALPTNAVFGGVDTAIPFRYTVESMAANKKTIALTVHATAWGVASADRLPLAKEQLLGRSATDVKRLSETFPEIESVDVKLSPFWLRSIPKREDRVELKIVSPTE